MPAMPWRPASEAETVSATTVFLDWLLCVCGITLDGPAALAEWRRTEAHAFAAAIASFAGLPPVPLREGGGGEGGADFESRAARPLPQPPPARRGGVVSVQNMMLRGHRERPALILPAGDGSHRVWSRATLCAADPLPETIEKMLANLALADLPALAASHLLDAGTAPDDCLHWIGDPAEPWPLGAWLAGASVMLGGDAGAGAIRTAPPWRD